MPKLGKTMTVEEGEGKVVRQNVLKGSITLLMDDQTEIEKMVSELETASPRNKSEGKQRQ